MPYPFHAGRGTDNWLHKLFLRTVSQRVVLLLDGGFVRKVLSKKPKAVPTADEVEKVCRGIMAKPALSGATLLRIYFYDGIDFFCMDKEYHMRQILVECFQPVSR